MRIPTLPLMSLVLMSACATEPDSSVGATTQALHERVARLAARNCNPPGTSGDVTVWRGTDLVNDFDYTLAFATFSRAPADAIESNPRGCRIVPSEPSVGGDAEVGEFVSLVDRADHENDVEFEGVDLVDGTYMYSASLGSVDEGVRWDVELAHGPRPYDGATTTTAGPSLLFHDAVRVLRFAPDPALVDEAGISHLRGGKPLVIHWSGGRDFSEVQAFFFDDETATVWQCTSDNDGRLVVPASVVDQLDASGNMQLVGTRREQRRVRGVGTLQFTSLREHTWRYVVE